MLSLVIPSYRGAELLARELPHLLAWLDRSGLAHEVVVVDDGSGDGGATERVALGCGCRFLGLPENRGKGAAVRAGMAMARGDFRIFTDADIPFEPEAIGRFLDYLDRKEFHVVVGDRGLKASHYMSAITPLRRLGSAVFTFLVGRFVTTGLSDTQCGLKGFRAEVAEDLFSHGRIDGFAFDVEILYIALKRNYDIKRLPVTYRGDHDASTVSPLRHGPGMMAALLRIKWNQIRGLYDRQEARP